MNHGTQEPSAASRCSRTASTNDELDTLKRELMKAELRLDKARATAVSAAIDINVLNPRLKALMQ
jgi:hypothetical protein